MLPSQHPVLSKGNNTSKRRSLDHQEEPARSAKKDGHTTKDAQGRVTAAVKRLSKSSRNASPPKHATSNTKTILPLVDEVNHDDQTETTLSSTPQLISLSESPRTQRPSYEDKVATPGWNSKEHSVLPHTHTSTVSQLSNCSKPVNHHANIDTQVHEDYSEQRGPYAMRRSPVYSQFSHNATSGLQPPLPHQSQPHFYGALESDLLLSSQRPGVSPGERGFYCGFDALPVIEQSSTLVDNVVLAGHDGGVVMYRVNKRGLSQALDIGGLRGAVIHARILPWTFRGNKKHQFPLIALVIHGPASNDGTAGEGSMPSPDPRLPSDDTVHSSPKLPGHSNPDSNANAVKYYQTTVEIWSLSTQRHVTTLLSTPKNRASTARVASAPLLPIGSLCIRADDGNIVVSSGTTGETWIFCHKYVGNGRYSFKCLGKIWTTLQHGTLDDPRLLDTNWQSPENLSVKHHIKAPIISLKGRYLAYCPSTPSSQTSLRATVLAHSLTVREPGLNCLAPPQVPQVNCLVDITGGESMLMGMAKSAMQELSKGASYAGEFGFQAWNRYWHGPPGQTNSANPYSAQTHMTHHFPPTHGVTNHAPPTKDPGLVSILDLDALAKQSTSAGAPPHPAVTFKIPQGCSFLSLSPNGLSLFTASSNGDLQIIWDLMRIQHVRSSLCKPAIQSLGPPSPHVRQIAQFSRMTIARIVDVVWACPHGDRVIMVTEPGTVHVLDLPASAFSWPPPHRKPSIPKSTEDEGQNSGAKRSVGGAFSSIWNTARPFVAQRRRSSLGMSGMTAANVKAQAGHGTQALVAGISRSVGAATGKMNEIRKSSGTRLHLPPCSSTSVLPSSGCIRLLEGKRNDQVFVVYGGVVGLYTVRARKADRPAGRQKARQETNYVEFRLPPLPENKHSPEFLPDLDQDDFDLRSEEEDHHWQLRKTSSPFAQAHGAGAFIPQAEIESNAPYQPFHTDRRIGLRIYSHVETQIPSPSVSALLSPPILSHETAVLNSLKPWAFGGPIHSTNLDVSPSRRADDVDDAAPNERALPSSAMERILKVADSAADGEQIVVTTRKCKGVARSGTEYMTGIADEEGFFEDDCEVLDVASQRV